MTDHAQYQLLMKAFSGGMLSHAYIFYGPNHDLQKSVVRQFGAFLSCTDKQKDDRCGRCPACKSADSGHILGAQVFSIEKGDKTIKIDQIREIIRFTSLKQAGGEYKIIIIENSEDIEVQARDLLLKVLEEPTPGTIFFLLSGDKNRLSKTILSRCQSLFFPDLPGERNEKEELMSRVFSGENASTSEDEKKKELDEIARRVNIILTPDVYDHLVLAKDMAQSPVADLRKLIGFLSFILSYNKCSDYAQAIPVFSQKNKCDIIPKVLDVLLEYEHLLSQHKTLNTRLVLESCFFAIDEILLSQ